MTVSFFGDSVVNIDHFEAFMTVLPKLCTTSRAKMSSCKMIARIARSCHPGNNHRWISTSPRGCNDQKENDLERRRKEMMARGLPKQKPIKGVKQILLVASGKGGVGKSTVSVNLATALKVVNPEKLIGLLDTDVFGPSIPLMMNVNESPLVDQRGRMVPLVNYGIKCMSMGFLLDEKSPVIWRGLMVMSAIDRLLNQVSWGPLDYLIVDTPPGTGDTHLSLIQNIPVTGALLVTTPQRAALEVTRRGATMFQKLNVPIAGIVENMSSVQCLNCANEIPLFGNGTQAVADDLGIQILESIPLCEEVRESSDTGKPVVLSKPEGKQAETYKRLARKVTSFLSQKPANEE